MNFLLPLVPFSALLLLADNNRVERATPTGVYGVCGCAEEAPGSSPIALTVNNDGTFHYVNATAPEHAIDNRGHWQLDGRKLVLTSEGGSEQTWTLDKDDPCLRTRSGLTFTRLCRLENCH